MSKQNPRTFTPEFRQMAIDLALQGHQTVAQIERDLGLSSGLLRQWLKKYRTAQAAGTTVDDLAEERREVARLRRENQRLQEEVAILKKAVTMTHLRGFPAHPPHGGSSS